VTAYPLSSGSDPIAVAASFQGEPIRGLHGTFLASPAVKQYTLEFERTGEARGLQVADGKTARTALPVRASLPVPDFLDGEMGVRLELENNGSVPCWIRLSQKEPGP
jgi:hypothetical protein